VSGKRALVGVFVDHSPHRVIDADGLEHPDPAVIAGGPALSAPARHRDFGAGRDPEHLAKGGFDRAALAAAPAQAAHQALGDYRAQR
jgi:hypothetical protein